MNIELTWIGVLRGAYYVPVGLAFAVAARHGRYLPLWLPECGMVAAFLAYAMAEKASLALGLAVLVACLAGTSLALVAHYSLFAVYAKRPDPFKALLRSIGMIVVLENLVGMVSGGYSLAFSGSEESVAGSLGWGNFHADKDTAVLAGVLLLAGILWILTNSTRMGLAYKAVSSNRELAQQYGLPIRKIDLLVILLAGGLCSLGGVINGLRYGLTADMMTANALKVVAVVVALGPERLPAIAIGLLCIGVLESYCQASIRFSAFEQGVSFAVLAVALVIRHCAAPIIARIRGAHYARGVEQSPEANP